MQEVEWLNSYIQRCKTTRKTPDKKGSTKLDKSKNDALDKTLDSSYQNDMSVSAQDLSLVSMRDYTDGFMEQTPLLANIFASPSLSKRRENVYMGSTYKVSFPSCGVSPTDDSVCTSLETSGVSTPCRNKSLLTLNESDISCTPVRSSVFSTPGGDSFMNTPKGTPLTNDSRVESCNFPTLAESCDTPGSRFLPFVEGNFSFSTPLNKNLHFPAVGSDLTSTPVSVGVHPKPDGSVICTSVPGSSEPAAAHRSQQPIKRGKSRRVLSHFMDASNHSRNYTHDDFYLKDNVNDRHKVSDENSYGVADCSGKSIPSSPQHSRVFREKQNNISSLKKNETLQGLDMDGIRPLNADEEYSYSYRKSLFSKESSHSGVLSSSVSSQPQPAKVASELTSLADIDMIPKYLKDETSCNISTKHGPSDLNSVVHRFTSEHQPNYQPGSFHDSDSCHSAQLVYPDSSFSCSQNHIASPCDSTSRSHQQQFSSTVNIHGPLQQTRTFPVASPQIPKTLSSCPRSLYQNNYRSSVMHKKLPLQHILPDKFLRGASPRNKFLNLTESPKHFTGYVPRGKCTESIENAESRVPDSVDTPNRNPPSYSNTILNINSSKQVLNSSLPSFDTWHSPDLTIASSSKRQLPFSGVRSVNDSFNVDDITPVTASNYDGNHPSEYGDLIDVQTVDAHIYDRELLRDDMETNAANHQPQDMKHSVRVNPEIIGVTHQMSVPLKENSPSLTPTKREALKVKHYASVSHELLASNSGALSPARDVYRNRKSLTPKKCGSPTKRFSGALRNISPRKVNPKKRWISRLEQQGSRSNNELLESKPLPVPLHNLTPGSLKIENNMKLSVSNELGHSVISNGSSLALDIQSRDLRVQSRKSLSTSAVSISGALNIYGPFRRLPQISPVVPDVSPNGPTEDAKPYLDLPSDEQCSQDSNEPLNLSTR